MCRYSFNSYKPHYVCFDCRKTFKQIILEEIIIRNGDWDFYRKAFFKPNSQQTKKFREENPELVDRLKKQYREKRYLCPDCGEGMNNIGLDFKAPKKDKIKAWEIVKSMYKLGNTFHTCGCNGPGYIPRKTSDYLNYLLEVKVKYQYKLADRKRKLTNTELNEYLEYWSSKLKLIELEIQRISAPNKP